ncbi:hypothetical protein BP00DRAFT_446125 [Aspergillus indologenus CBS 114.80]|uniref:Uncharacterized protein n=1 Tax=Aspergillus indologenus CBS 114.80 TaxID=1450541 RepID=A0A2V5ICI6_9EURO|nr:hypothetical protein BP00DRAFT_446125 [Aspergillus indologenus CBS 114.80]
MIPNVHNAEEINIYATKIHLSRHQGRNEHPSQDHEVNSSAICPEIKFPPIKETLAHLLRTLTEVERPELRHIPYKDSISAIGTINECVDILKNALHLAIIQFENKVVTTEMLHTVREKQALTEEWQRGNGYLSFVTDDRNA